MQTGNALENIRYLLTAAGSSMDDIVDVPVCLRNLDDFGGTNEVYREYLPPDDAPARVVVEAASPLAGNDVEIKVTACVRDADPGR